MTQQIYFSYEITNEEIARDFLFLGVVISLAFSFGSVALIYFAEKKGSLLFLIVFCLMPLVVMGFISSLYFTKKKQNSFYIGAEKIFSDVGDVSYEILTADVLEVLVATQSGRATYTMALRNGEAHQLPKLHRVAEGKVLDALNIANKKIKWPSNMWHSFKNYKGDVGN